VGDDDSSASDSSVRKQSSGSMMLRDSTSNVRPCLSCTASIEPSPDGLAHSGMTEDKADLRRDPSGAGEGTGVA
jgi:hypothetical protein